MQIDYYVIEGKAFIAALDEPDPVTGEFRGAVLRPHIKQIPIIRSGDVILTSTSKARPATPVDFDAFGIYYKLGFEPEYFVVDENTVVYTTGTPSEFGIECRVLHASNIRAKLYGKATENSSYQPFSSICLTPSTNYRKATQEDAKVFNIELPSTVN